MKYKYLRSNEKNDVKDKKPSNSMFVFQLVSFILLIVIFLSFGAFLFYKKLTGASSFTSIEDVPQALQGEENMKKFTPLDSENVLSTKTDEKSEDKSSKDKKEENVKKSNTSGNLCDYDFSEWNKTSPFELKIVNRSNPISKDYKPSFIRKVGEKEVSDHIYEPLMKMINDASKDGIKLWVRSGYRSYNYQKILFEDQVKRELKNEKNYEKATEKASTVVAKPGQSEHNLGLAVDINSVEGTFKNTPAYKWLSVNAHKYGFIERYKEGNKNDTGVIPEPWHYRYVGKYADEVSKYRSLEEYVKAKMK